MAIGKGGGDDWGALIALLLLGVGAIAYVYTKSGRGEENSPFIPDSLEGKIDLVVKRLNDHFGKQWVNYGLDVLQSYLAKVLPPEVVMVANAVIAVEQASRYRAVSGLAKQQAAVRQLRGLPW